MIVSPRTQDMAQPSLPHHLLTEIETLQQQIAAQIQNGCLHIASHPNMIPKPENTNLALKDKLSKLASIKEELANKLKAIAEQERDIKALSQKLENNHRNKREKSVITETDKERIGEIKKSQKQFEVMIRSKINRVMQDIKQKQQQEEAERAFQSDMKRKQRMVKLAQKRVKIAESRSKTLQMLDSSPVTIKKSQYAYIKYQLKDQKLQQQRKKINQLILKEKKEKLKIDFNQIKESAINHDKIINQKREDFLFELKESQIRNRTKTVAYESQFSRKLKSEEKIKEIERVRQDEARRQVRERTMNYQNVVDEKYKPKIREDSVFVPKKQVQILDQLSYVEAREKGNQFLRIACKKAKKKVELNESKIEVTSDQIGPSESLPTSTSQKYPNYLLELKKKNRETNLLERIIKQKRVSSRKVEEVIRWMQKKEEGRNIGPQKSAIKNQYSSALEKIKLLNSIYQNQQV